MKTPSNHHPNNIFTSYPVRLNSLPRRTMLRPCPSEFPRPTWPCHRRLSHRWPVSFRSLSLTRCPRIFCLKAIWPIWPLAHLQKMRICILSPVLIKARCNRYTSSLRWILLHCNLPIHICLLLRTQVQWFKRSRAMTREASRPVNGMSTTRRDKSNTWTQINNWKNSYHSRNDAMLVNKHPRPHRWTSILSTMTKDPMNRWRNNFFVFVMSTFMYIKHLSFSFSSFFTVIHIVLFSYCSSVMYLYSECCCQSRFFQDRCGNKLQRNHWRVDHCSQPTWTRVSPDDRKSSWLIISGSRVPAEKRPRCTCSIRLR